MFYNAFKKIGLVGRNVDAFLRKSKECQEKLSQGLEKLYKNDLFYISILQNSFCYHQTYRPEFLQSCVKRELNKILFEEKIMIRRQKSWIEKLREISVFGGLLKSPFLHEYATQGYGTGVIRKRKQFSRAQRTVFPVQFLRFCEFFKKKKSKKFVIFTFLIIIKSKVTYIIQYSKKRSLVLYSTHTHLSNDTHAVTSRPLVTEEQ